MNKTIKGLDGGDFEVTEDLAEFFTDLSSKQKPLGNDNLDKFIRILEDEEGY